MNTRKGTRTYVLLHPYVFEPILTFTVGLYNKPKQHADAGEFIGETIGRPKQEAAPEPEAPATKVVRQQPVRQARSKRSGKR